MLVEFDTKKKHPTRIQDRDEIWWVLHGKCARCGQCCHSGCDNLTAEKIDGMWIMKCKAQFFKPVGCAMYPCDPKTPLKPGCGFHWERE